jgi:DNA-binding NarL/FixJ family response regulator
MTKKRRIVIADDHPIILGGLRNLVKAEPDLELVGEASSGLAALKVIREQQPDLAVIDITMPELNGIVLSRRLIEEMPSVKVLILTAHEDRAYLQQALDAGVRGYVLKRSAAENLIQAIHAVIIGGLYIDPEITNLVFDARPKRAGRQNSYGSGLALTEREAEVLKLVALGFTNKEIARKFNVGIKSIETQRLRGSEKLGLGTRAELVRYASAQGWLENV